MWGAVPLAGLACDGEPDGPIAVLTIGRTSPRRLPRFAGEAPALLRSVLDSPGLVTALSVGFPLLANCTFTVWRSSDAMMRFAYGREAGAHRATVARDRDPGILTEQMTARFRPFAIGGSWDPDATARSAALAALRDELARV